MKKSVSLARGLKEKNRLAGKLRELRESISLNNSHDEDVPRDIDVEKTLEATIKIKERLTAVKIALAEANKEIVGLIIGLEELKSEIAWLKGLDTTSRTTKTYYAEKEIVHRTDAVITGSAKLKMVEELQAKANKIQDELDDFNASHRICIEIDD